MISIQDNGNGLEPSSAKSLGTGAGIGIAGMKRRAIDLGIAFTLSSTATGTTIELRW